MVIFGQPIMPVLILKATQISGVLAFETWERPADGRNYLFGGVDKARFRARGAWR